MAFLKISNKIIKWGIIFLLVFTPIAFGAVHPWAYTLMELTICFLSIIWIVRLAMINIRKTSPIRNPKSEIRNMKVNRFGFIKTPLNIPIMLFIGLILFQLVPLPPGVIKILSPNTYELYRTTLPGWPGKPPFTESVNNQTSAISRSNSSNSLNSSNGLNGLNGLNIPTPPSSLVPRPSYFNSWCSISLYRHATWKDLYKILACTGIFLLIVNYNPSTRSRQPVTKDHQLRIRNFIIRIVVVMIIVGCFESVYGLLEYLSGHQHIFFRQKVVHLESVTGTYLNRNHFAAYVAFVICMSFGYITYKSSGRSDYTVSGWRKRLISMISKIGTKNALLFFLILIMSAAVILSGSRMGICSFITAVIIMSILITKKMSAKKTFFIILPVCLVVVWLGINPVIKRFSQTSEHIESEAGRVAVWRDTSNLIKDYPVLGTGLGTYEYTFPRYKSFRAQILYDHAHNDYLQLMSDTGIVGFMIAVAGGVYFLIVIMKIWFKRKDPFVRCMTIGCLGGIAYIILHSLTDFNLQIPANALQLSVITGIMHKTVTQL